jgi:hypothetical protein
MLLLAGLRGTPQSDIRSVTGIVTDRSGNVLARCGCTIGEYCYAVDHVARQARRRALLLKPKTLSKFTSARKPAIDLVTPIE